MEEETGRGAGKGSGRETDKGIIRKNAALAGVWVALLLIVGSAVALMVFTALGQYYEVSRYLIVEASATAATIALAWLWLYLTTSTSSWVATTHTFWASLLFVLTAWAIAAASWAICPWVYTSDGRNPLPLNAALVLPATFTALMYACPPVQVTDTILPGGGIGQLAARWLIALAMGALAAWLFLYNFS